MGTDVAVRPAAELMQEAFDAISEKDLDRLAGVWDENSTDVFMALDLEVTGKEALRSFFAEFFVAIPDLDFATEAIHPVDQDLAVGQWRIRGTFSGGPFQGIEPTGRPVDIRGIDVMRFEDGVLRHNDVYYDGLSFARQVGMLPAADSPADKAITTAFNAVTKTKRAVRDRLGR